MADTAAGLLDSLHHELEQACAPAAHAAPGLGALAGRLVDALKREGGDAKAIRRAEGILLDLQRVEMSRRAHDGKHGPLLASCRDAARMMVADMRRARLAGN